MSRGGKKKGGALYTNQESAPDGIHQATERNCALCAELGRSEAARTHDLADCFAYPKSRMFKENVHKMRVRELTRSGKPIPELMKKSEGEDKEKPA